MTRTYCLAIWAMSAVAHAATGGSPDWTGYYMLARGADLAGLTLISPDFDKTVAEHLQPWAKLRMAETNGIADDAGAACKPMGFLRAIGAPFSGNFFLLPSHDRVTIVYWPVDTAGVRRIHLNQEHPKNLKPTWNGHSIGRWEGDTLVVDTIGFNDQSWLSGGMAPHTEETHLVERMRQIQQNNNTYIELTGIVEDRQALTSAYMYRRYYKKQKLEMDNYVCNDDAALWKQWRKEALEKESKRAAEVK